jgi:hypothetical protein
MAFKLADLFVQFSARGADVVQNVLSSLKASMLGLGAAADAAGIGITQQFAKITADLTVVVKGVEAAGGAAITEMNNLQRAIAKIDVKARPEVNLVGVVQAQKDLEKLSDQLVGRRQFVGLSLGVGGSSELNKALMEIKANLKELNAELLKQIPGIFLGKLEELSKSAARGFAVMTVGITGFVTAGLSGTALGERLTFQLSMLSREIANVFLPVIESISNGLQRLIDWFRSLTGEQQNSIAYWSVFGITVLGIVGTIGKVIAIVRELKTALAGLAIVQALLNGLTLNFAAIAGGIAAVALVGGTLALANEAGKAATGGATASSGKGGSRTGAPQIKEFDKLGRPIYYEPGEISNVTGQPIRGGVARNQLDNASSGFSSLQETFRRVQLAALRQNVGITNEEKQLLAQERTARATEATASYLQKKKPALGS